jgi:hypothetical protein
MPWKVDLLPMSLLGCNPCLCHKQPNGNGTPTPSPPPRHEKWGVGGEG